MTRARYLFFAVALVVFILDRASKAWVVQNLAPGRMVPVLPHLWLTRAENQGAAFGFAQGGSLLDFFTLASIVVAAGIVVYVVTRPVDLAGAAVLGLILGGAVGNGYDRLFLGGVTDFIDVRFWPVFNLADAAVTVGVVLMVLGLTLRPKSSG